jgi:hypothetical protein
VQEAQASGEEASQEEDGHDHQPCASASSTVRPDPSVQLVHREGPGVESETHADGLAGLDVHDARRHDQGLIVVIGQELDSGSLAGPRGVAGVVQLHEHPSHANIQDSPPDGAGSSAHLQLGGPVHRNPVISAFAAFAHRP